MCASEIQEGLTPPQYIPNSSVSVHEVASVIDCSSVRAPHHENARQKFDEAFPYGHPQICSDIRPEFVLDEIEKCLPEELYQYSSSDNANDGVTRDNSADIENLEFSNVSNQNFVEETSNQSVEKINPDGLLAKYALPCQNNPQYDYNQCYSFYANGCYNTCQFVNVCDIEDFMNNEKRKEKSRDAARCRRSKETEIFNDLGTALPLPTDQISQLDKASVMRLAISYLKVRDMINLVPLVPIKDKLNNNLKDESLFLQSLEGFILVLSTDGDFIYLSENVTDYLGITQIDLMGQNIFEYSHPCDHEEITDMLSSKNQEAPKSAFIRLKCTLTSKGKSVNLKSATYKVIHCTGHMIQDPCKDEDPKSTTSNKIRSCFAAVGQPIPHPSNIDTPLPTQTFLTKHNVDMKFTHADDKFMMDVLGYTSEDLLNKSAYEYHHALDSEAIGSAYKCLFSKGQCETSRYRFLAKTGGYCWVVTQATMIYDKMQKPQSVVCVNHVISGVENKDEIYALHQLAAAKEKVVNSGKVVPEIRVEVVKKDPEKGDINDSRKVPVSTTRTLFGAIPRVDSAPKLFVSTLKKPEPELRFVHEPPQVDRGVKSFAPTTSKKLDPVVAPAELLFGARGCEANKDVLNGAKPPEVAQPHSSTKSIFAPRTEDMNKGFLAYNEKEAGLTMTQVKEDLEDLTHLAPTAGDACIPLDENLDEHPFLNDNMDWLLPLEDSNFVPLLNNDPTDPFISYRNYRDSSPQLLSPNLSKSPDCSLPSLCSPNGSLSDEDQMSTFINLQMDDDCEGIAKAPYISMGEELPLFMSSSDLLWSSNEKIKEQIPETNSSLAELLSSSVNKHSIKHQSDHGGGGTGKRGFLEIPSDNTQSRPWLKTPIKIEVDSIRPSTKTTMERTQSIKRQNASNCYDHQTKRSRQEPKSSELLHQLMSNNHTTGNRGRGKGKSMCISQPSDSVLMNLLVSGFDIRAGYICLAPTKTKR